MMTCFHECTGQQHEEKHKRAECIFGFSTSDNVPCIENYINEIIQDGEKSTFFIIKLTRRERVCFALS